MFDNRQTPKLLFQRIKELTLKLKNETLRLAQNTNDSYKSRKTYRLFYDKRTSIMNQFFLMFVLR